MSTLHYNELFENTWRDLGYDVVYQPSCLQGPYDNICWKIKYPQISWNDHTVVLMHCQDFLSTQNGGCQELERMTHYFGDRANQVIAIHWNIGLGRVYSGPIKLIHFPTHTYEILKNLQDQVRYGSWWENYSRTRNLAYQCLNGQPRPHRRVVHEWLKQHGHGITSLANFDLLPRGDDYYSVYNWDIEGGELNEKNFLRLCWLYQDAKINIVTETQYIERPGIITEKTLFALLARQIPLVIGYPGIVSDCQDLGIDMFSDLIDTSYDQIEQDHLRWQQALELNQHLLEPGLDLTAFQDRLTQQQTWARLHWPNIMIDRWYQQSHEIHNVLATG